MTRAIADRRTTRRATGAPIVLLNDHGVRIPAGLDDLEAFRAWARSGDFPETGRIDWIGGDLEVDMSPEDLNTHGTPKSAIARRLGALVEEERDSGVVLVDRMRVTVPSADLSVEPDVVVVLFASLRAGKIRLVPKASREQGRFVEIEGPPDIVVECVSDSSETKDRERLLERYHRAGVAEYWLVDARGRDVDLRVHRRAGKGWSAARPDKSGFLRSRVLGVAVRLVRRPAREGAVRYRLEIREE